ncbi:MAG TPA: hypothetical protein VLS89_03505, partial [Candidatus Nanopelagicales bacterium]|nr:hypothetical protein [Candidatus Nanopelagicales bacterium]
MAMAWLGAALGAALAAALGAGCGGAHPASESSAGVTAKAPPAVAPAPAMPAADPASAGSAEAAPKAPSPDTPAPAAPSAAPEPAIPFPPASFTPPHERTAKPGDGAWTPLPEGTTERPPILARTTVHPHKIKPFVYVNVVAIDLGRAELRLVAGTQEPVAKSVPPERRPGLVPAADQGDLLAVFNGGFMARHGKYGMMVEGDVFLPPRADVCTVALSGD